MDQYSKGAFHSAQNSGKFWLEIKWKGPLRFSSTGTDLGPPLKVVHFDRSAHFGWSDRNVPFHSKKLLSPERLFSFLLARTISKCAVAWDGSVQPECTFPLSTSNFQNFKGRI